MNARVEQATKRRFGQGNEVDRARPHVFHRDYWPLRLIREGVEGFFRENVRGGRVLDLGAGQSPYAGLARAAGAELVLADIDPPAGSGALAIDVSSGRVPLGDGSVDAILSTQV